MNYVIQKVENEFQDLHERTQSCSIGLIFEETLKKTSDLFENCIVIKLKLMSLLNSDYIDINIFQKFGIDLFKKRIELRRFLSNLSNINIQNYLLKDIITGYLDHLSFIETKDQIINKKLYLKQQRNHDLLLKKRQRYGDQISYKYSASEDSKVDKEQTNQNVVFNPFERNVCAIFMKLRNQDLGKIWRVQDSFTKIFGFKNPIGQNINLIIPNSLHTSHNNVIKNFINTVNPLGMKLQKISLAIGNTIEGFGIPIQVEVSIDHVTHFNEIGIIAMIKTIECESHFVLLEIKSKQLKTNLITKDFYYNYLNAVYTIQEISSLNFIKIIPIINYSLSDTSNNNKLIQSIAFLPINSEDGQASKNFFKNQSSFSKKSNQIDLDYYTNNACVQVYIIDFQIHTFQNKEFNSQIVEIKKFQKLKKQKDINYELFLLEEKIEEYQNNTQIMRDLETQIEDRTIFKSSTQHESQKWDNQQINFSKNSNFLQISDRILKSQEGLISPRSTEYIDSKRSPSFSTYNDFLSPQTSRRSYVQTVVQDKKIDDSIQELIPENSYRRQSESNGYNKNYFPSKQTFQYPIGKQVQSITVVNGLDTTDNKKQKLFLGNKIEEQDDLEDEGSYENSQILNKDYRIKRNTLEMVFPIKKRDSNFNQASFTKKQTNEFSRNYNDQTKQLHNQIDNNYSYQLKSDGQLVPKFPSDQHAEEMISYAERRSSYLQVNSMEDKLQGQENIEKDNEQDKGSSVRSSSNFEKSMNKKSTKIRANQSSVQSSHSSTKEALKTVQRKIMSLQQSLGLQILNLVGILSVMVIVILLIIIFTDILIAFKKASIDFYFIQWPKELSFSTAFLQYLNIIIRMNQYNVFPDMTASWKDYLAANNKMILTFQDKVDVLLTDQIKSDYNYSPYFKQLTTTTTDWIDLREYKTYPNSVNKYTTLKSYFLQCQLSTYKTLQMYQNDYVNQQAIIIENYDNYVNLNDELQSSILESAINSLNSIFNKVLILMILCITLTFGVIIFIFPIYSYIQSQREEVLKLFSTIPSTGIMRMAIPGIMILESLNQQSSLKNQSKKNIKQKENNSSRQLNSQTVFSTKSTSTSYNKDTGETITQVGREIIIKSLETSQKKKNISRTTMLPRFSLPLLTASFALFLIIITIPIVNSVLINKFRNESVLNINLISKNHLFYNLFNFIQKYLLFSVLSFKLIQINFFINIDSLFNLKEAFSETLFFAYYHIYGKFNLKEGALYKPEIIASKFLDMQKANDLLVQDLLTQVSQSEQMDRYGNSEYVKFFYPVLESDICQHLQENPQYTQNESFTIDYTICDKPKNTILKKGLQTVTKYYFNELYQSFEISNSYTDQQYAKEMQTWQSDFDIKNFNEFFTMVVKVIIILKDFMDMQGKNYIDEMKLTEIILTCSQIFILLFVFYFGWISFYYSTSQQMNQTRRLLSLIDINVIVDNSYIMSYLNKIK